MLALVVAVVADVKPSSRDLAALAKDAAALLVALGILAAFVWRIIRPHFERLVREAASTRTATQETAHTLAGLPDQVQRVEDGLARMADLPTKVAALDGRVDTLQDALLMHLTKTDRSNEQ